MRHYSIIATGILSLIGMQTTLAQSDPTFISGAPRNLTVTPDEQGLLVSWDWPCVAAQNETYGFEDDTFLPDGWSIVSSDNATATSTWFRYPDHFGGEGDSFLLHGGTCSAMIAMHDEDLPQDEWLIAKVPAGTVYLEFWTFLPPEVVEYGQSPEFPDRYYVQVSHDNGETWQILWDACRDADACDTMQEAAIYLGRKAGDSTLVAWHARSSEEEGLYGIWAIDDVSFLGVTESPVTAGPSKAPERTFESDDAYFYIVERDGEPVSGELGRLYWHDREEKCAGTYNYKVYACNTTTFDTYEAASVEYVVAEQECPAPANLRAAVEYDEAGDKYEISLMWDAPDGRTPRYYNVTGDGARVATMLEEPGAGQSGLKRGVYTYQVFAEYTNPTGTSEPARITVAAGTQYPPVGLRIEGDRLVWDAYTGSESSPAAYDVYHGNTLISDGTTDNSLPMASVPDVKGRVSVHAVYDNGERSLPAVLDIESDDTVRDMPFTESFDGGHLPAGWDVTRGNDFAKMIYQWRFDNWYGTPEPECAVNEFASISCESAAFSDIYSQLVTPTVDCTNTATVYIDFDLLYSSPRTFGNCMLNLEVSIDGGENWEIAESYSEDTESHQCLDISGFAAGSKVRFRWNYRDRFGRYAAIDNVRIASEPAGINDIADDSCQSQTEFYTLQGIRTVNPGPGLYIGVRGNNATKVVIK